LSTCAGKYQLHPRTGPAIAHYSTILLALVIGYVLTELHLTMAKLIERSLTMAVSIVLKLSDYPLSSVIERVVSLASIQPFFDHHRKQLLLIGELSGRSKLM
jgi:hypothetical protein